MRNENYKLKFDPNTIYVNNKRITRLWYRGSVLRVKSLFYSFLIALIIKIVINEGGLLYQFNSYYMRKSHFSNNWNWYSHSWLLIWEVTAYCNVISHLCCCCSNFATHREIYWYHVEISYRKLSASTLSLPSYLS